MTNAEVLKKLATMQKLSWELMKGTDCMIGLSDTIEALRVRVVALGQTLQPFYVGKTRHLVEVKKVGDGFVRFTGETEDISYTIWLVFKRNGYSSGFTIDESSTVELPILDREEIRERIARWLDSEAYF